MGDVHQKLVVGPPNTRFMGLNTTGRRQQLMPNEFRKLRGWRMQGEALERVKGNLRLECGDLPAASLTLNGNADDYVSIPVTLNGVSLTEWDLLQNWTLFASYTPLDLNDDIMVCSHGTDAAPPWRIVHQTDKTIDLIVEDGAGNQATLSTTNTYDVGSEVQLQAYRQGGTLGLLVNDDDAVTDTSTIGAAQPMKTSVDPVYLGSWSGRTSGSEMTLHEFAVWTRTRTSREWRATQYPNTGRFGDPSLLVHLLFEDGTGSTTVTDYSRRNQTVSLNGSYTWNATTDRQTIAPVTGMHMVSQPSGRKWLIADIGKNHYRFFL